MSSKIRASWAAFIILLCTGKDSYGAVRTSIAEIGDYVYVQKEDAIPIKPVIMLGVRLGEHISTYKITKIVNLGEYGDRHIIDPSTVDRPGDMSLYKWEYSAKVNSEGIVYAVDCKMETTKIPFGMKDDKPKGPPLDLFIAIREIYSEKVSYDSPQKFTVKGKEGFLISVESKMIGRDDYGLWWNGTIRLFHKDTNSAEIGKRMGQNKNDIRRRNKDL